LSGLAVLGRSNAGAAGGHDSYWWQQQLPGALAWLLAPHGLNGIVGKHPQLRPTE
jgi:hypothetical protein